jgi:hypothetical protein
MAAINENTFKKRDELEKRIIGYISDFQKVIAPVVNKWDIIKFEIERAPVFENEDINGEYEIIVVEKSEENVELAIIDSKEEYEEIIPFSELSLLDSKLVKVLLFGIKNGTIVNTINKMNANLWNDGLMMEEFYY